MKLYKIAVALSGLACLLVPTANGAANSEITVWSWFIASTMEKSIKAFEEKNPGLKVKYTYYNYSPQYIPALKAAAASNSLPDIIGLQPGSLTQQYREQLVPLNSYAAKEWGNDWTSTVFPVALKQLTMGNPSNDSNYYLLPQECQYNKETFQKLGLTVPQTYQEMVNAAKRLSDNGYIPMYQGAADGWQNENVFLMIANQLSPGLVEQAQAGKASWSSPALLSAMEGWSKLFKDRVFQEGALGARAYPTGAQLFAQGRVGMMALGSWWMQESKFPPPLSRYIQNMSGFDFFYFPALTPGGKPSPPVGGVDIGYALTKNGAKNPEAWKFLASLVKGISRPSLDLSPRAGSRRTSSRCTIDSSLIYPMLKTSASRIRRSLTRSTTLLQELPPAQSHPRRL